MRLFQDQWFVGIVLSVLLLWFFVVLYTDRYIQDIDGDPARTSLIHGQDSPAFAGLGERIAHGEEFTTEAGMPEVFCPPGYPVLLAVYTCSIAWNLVWSRIVIARHMPPA